MITSISAVRGCATVVGDLLASAILAEGVAATAAATAVAQAAVATTEANSAHADRVAVEAAIASSASDRAAAHTDRLASDADAAATATDRAATHTDKLAADADATATAADRAQTALDRVSTTASAAAAATSATGAATSKTAADADATAAHADRLAADADVALTHADVTLTHADVTSANTARDLALSYQSAAQVASANAQVVSGLSNLSNAARATLISTTVVVAREFETSRDVYGPQSPINWRFATPNNSCNIETLNTTTRGTVPTFPSRGVLIGQTATLTVQNDDDPAGPLWKSWTVAGLTSVRYHQGVIWYCGTGGLYAIDLVADLVFQITASAWNVCLNQTVATFNQSTATWGVYRAGVIANALTFDVDCCVYPLTPPNKLRLGMPNSTVAVGTTAGVSIIHADGVITKDTNLVDYESVCFDEWFNLWIERGGVNSLYVIQPSGYLTAGFGIGAYQSLAGLGLGSLRNNGLRAIPGGVAIAGSTGVARIKIDPTNGNNSLVSIKTSTCDTGFMPGGYNVAGGTPLIKCALAESSSNTGSLGGSPLNDTFGTDPGGYLSGSSAAPYSVSGGAMVASFPGTGYYNKAMTTVVGRTYKVRVSISAFSVATTFYFGASMAPGSSWINYYSTAAIGNYTVSFVATATTTYFTMWSTSTGTVSLTSIGCDMGVIDRSAAQNVINSNSNCFLANGTVSLSAVASGADLYAYGGFSASNFLSGGNLLNGATDCFMKLWWGFGTNGTEYVMCWGDATFTNDGFVIRYVAGGLYAAIKRGGSIVNANLTFTRPTGGIFGLVLAVIRGTRLELWNNGSLLAFATISATAFSNGSAVSTIGTDLAGNNTNGSVALPQFGAFAPTPDQIAFMYAAELPRFAAGAKDLLSGAAPTAIAYDPETDQLAVSNSTAGTDVFKGSVRVSNQKSTTGANLFPFSALPSVLAYTNASLGAKVSAFASWGGEAWQLLDTVASTAHYWGKAGYYTASGSQAYAFTVPLKAAAQGWAQVCLSSVIWANINLATGAVGTTNGSPSAVTVSALATGEWLVTVSGTPIAATHNGFVQPIASNTVYNYAGAGTAALIFGKPMLTLGATVPTAYSDGLTLSDNHKAVAFSGGDLVIGTAAGVDSILASAPGLRETAKGRKPVPVYDPNFAVFNYSTSGATPVAVAAFVVPEGRDWFVDIKGGAGLYGGTITENVDYVIEGSIRRNVGGTALSALVTRTINEVTTTQDLAGTHDATNNLCVINATGKASSVQSGGLAIRLIDKGL
jgi:hypothetical protein